MKILSPDRIEFWVIILIVFIAINISNKVLDNSKFNILLSMDKKMIRYGLISKRMLCELSNDKFLEWCIDLLRRIWHTHIESISYPRKYEKYLKCIYNNKRF